MPLEYISDYRIKDPRDALSIYIYIYIERERDRYIYIYIYILKHLIFRFAFKVKIYLKCDSGDRIRDPGNNLSIN